MIEPSLNGSSLNDRYRLLEVIGEGGMGRVFRAEQLATGQPVAVKLLHPEFAQVDQVVRRFEREAKVTTELSHPHIVKTIEFGEWNGRLFLAMELIAGQSLAQLIERDDGSGRGRRMTVKRTLAIMRTMLDALEYAHGLGVVHRDLKPENIMVIPGRNILARESIKLLDFGIAKLGDHSDRSAQKLTQHGLVLGTPGYMSPEQAAGQEADERSDLYSCGVMMYQMLAGQRPFEADSNLDVLVMHLNTQPRSLQEVAPDAWIPPAVDNVVLRALAKRPAERFQSAGELRRALERAVLADYSGVGVDGLGATVLAPSRVTPPPRLPVIRFTVMTAALALGLGHHLPRRASVVNEPARRAHAGGGAAAVAPPPPSRDHARQPEPAPAREPPARPTHATHAKHDAKPARTKAHAKPHAKAHAKAKKPPPRGKH
ncbi:MAG TPA: serine/threonine-protein kinase [Polyangia bacterium]